MLKLYKEIINSPLGNLSLVTDDDGNLRAVEWEDFTDRLIKLLKRHYGEKGFDLRSYDRSKPSDAAKALENYFKNPALTPEKVKTETNGTPFQKQVWAELRQIPSGTTISYGELARRIGNPSAVRAVGLANGANPIGIIVPCHRVIGANGKLTGYAGGVDKKRWLLDHEAGLQSVFE